MKNKKLIQREEKRGLVCGAFDLCHAGHMLMFKECKEVCDYLIVGLQTDPSLDRPEIKNKPIQTIEERLIILDSVKYIDEVFVYTTEAELFQIMKENKLGIQVRIVDENKGSIENVKDDFSFDWYQNKRNHKYSSTNLRKRVYEEEAGKKPKKLQELDENNWLIIGD